MDWQESLDLVVERTKHRRYRELCDEAHPDHAIWRRKMVEKATGELPTPASYPGLFRQASNLAGAIGRAAGALATGHAITVPDDVHEARLALCRTCEHYDPGSGKCRLCGCVLMHRKASLAQEQCPLSEPRWTRWEEEPDVSRAD